jgi:EmrB/QacA subfamily drug resistance transporter
MALAVFVIANDITSLSVAVPQMERTFHTDVGTVQWVMNVYNLLFGVLIVTGGRLSDTLGRRRMFFVGIAIFGLFSAVGAVAWSSGVLIGARAAMAIGAALIWPSVVGLIFALVPPERAGLAGGLLIGVSGLGNSLGPMIGGLLTEELSWRWIMVLNLPIAAAAVALVHHAIAPDATSDVRERLDWPGVATLSVCLLALMVALDQASDWGWGDGRVIALLVISVAALGAFLVTQRRAGGDALIPPDIVANRSFAAACVTIALVTGTFFATLLYVPQYMERILGMSALTAGVSFLPMMLTFSVAAFASGPIYNRLGPRPLLLCGVVCLPLGALLLSLVSVDSSYIDTVPGLFLIGVGTGVFYSSVTNAALTSLDSSRTGVGSGITFMFQLVSGAVAVAIATAVFLDAAGTHGPSASGFVAGFQAALRVVAAIGACGLITVWGILRPGTSAPEAPGPSEPALAD